MHSSIIFSKTRLGEEAIANRSLQLDRKLRLVLILVDGHSDIKQLQNKATAIDGLEQALEQLALEGFIQPDNEAWQPVYRDTLHGHEGMEDSSDPQVIKARLVDAAILVLGKDAEKIIKVLHEAPDTLDGLEEAVTRCKKIVDLTIDENRSAELKRKCLEIIGRM